MTAETLARVQSAGVRCPAASGDSPGAFLCDRDLGHPGAHVTRSKTGYRGCIGWHNEHPGRVPPQWLRLRDEARHR